MESAAKRLANIASHLVDEKVDELSQGLETVDVSAEKGPLDDERKNPSFDIRELTYFLDGGKETTEMKEAMASVIENDPVLRDDDRFDHSRPESRKKTMEKVKRVIEFWGSTAKSSKEKEIPRSGQSKKKVSSETAFWDVMSLYDPSWATRVGVHYGLFINAINGQGTPEQQKKWAEPAVGMKIIGCFCMTELGHGSYIRGFETTAHYDKSTQEFVINSPTDTSTKWWIGMLGQTATHTVVYARLIIDGTDHGVFGFVVQIRELATGKPLPGISVGDCGAKMGRQGIDNGWIQFHHVRIPRGNMLMKWSQVTPEGKFIQPPKAQLSYGALIGGRVGMIQDSSDFAKKALTIAIRYSAVRRQFPSPNGNHEEQIINYQTHQMRLLPILATCFAYHFTGHRVKQRYEQMQTELEKGSLDSLAGVHATSAGLKAFSTWWCLESLEQCRQCLGGHGYSAYSALPSFMADFAVMCSWEGDNTVMAQQTAKFLMKMYKQSLSGKKPLTGFEKYLENIPATLGEDLRVLIKSPKDLLNHTIQLKILRKLAVGIIARTAGRLANAVSNLKDKTKGWNEVMYALVQASRVHCDFYVIDCFIETVQSAPENPDGVRKMIEKLGHLHTLFTINKYLGLALLEEKVLTSEQAIWIEDNMYAICKDIRKDAVPLVDSFNFPDFVLNTPLGRYDGQVYKHYLETVKRAPNAIGVPQYFESDIKPLLMGFKQE